MRNRISYLSVFLITMMSFMCVFAQQRMVISVNTNVTPPIVDANIKDADLNSVLSALFSYTDGLFMLETGLGVQGNINELVINKQSFNTAFKMIVERANQDNRNVKLNFTMVNNYTYRLTNDSPYNTYNMANNDEENGEPNDVIVGIASPDIDTEVVDRFIYMTKAQKLKIIDIWLPPHGYFMQEEANRSSSTAAPGTSGGFTTGGTGLLQQPSTRPSVGASSSSSSSQAIQKSIAKQTSVQYKMAAIPIDWVTAEYVISMITGGSTGTGDSGSTGTTTTGTTSGSGSGVDAIFIPRYMPDTWSGSGTSGSGGTSSGSNNNNNNNNNNNSWSSSSSTSSTNR